MRQTGPSLAFAPTTPVLHSKTKPWPISEHVFWRWYTRWGYLVNLRVSANRNRGGLRAQHTHEDFAWAERSPYCTLHMIQSSVHAQATPSQEAGMSYTTCTPGTKKWFPHTERHLHEAFSPTMAHTPVKFDATPSTFCFPDDYSLCKVDTEVVRGLKCCKPSELNGRPVTPGFRIGDANSSPGGGNFSRGRNNIYSQVI